MIDLARLIAPLAATVLTAACVGVTGAPAETPVSTPAAVKSLEETWGIKVVAVRISAGGHIVDLRYEVVEPEKAAGLTRPETKLSMVDVATGTKLTVPNTPKLGPLRQSATKPEKGRTYFVLFTNRGRVVKPGSKVIAQLGDCRIEGLTVE